MPDAEEILIRDCIGGRRNAQEKLYKKYAPALLGICMRYAKNREEAEDILQEGFIKVFINIGKFRGEGSFEGWMKRIMVNTAITHNKQVYKHLFHADIDDVEERQLIDEDDQKEEFDIRIPPKKLMEIIQQLPEGYRMVFNLYIFEQYTHKEIADMLGVSVNTSKSQLSKARRYLVSKIEKFAGTKKIGLTE